MKLTYKNLSLKKDELLDILTRKLKQLDPDSTTAEELICETVKEYIERLLLRGHIPAVFMDGIERDLQDEVIEMYRKKTYGHMDLKSYKESQKNKKSTQSA